MNGPSDFRAADRAVAAAVAARSGYPALLLDPGMDLVADLGMSPAAIRDVLDDLAARFSSAPPPDPSTLRTLRDVAVWICASVPPAGAEDGPLAGCEPPLTDVLPPNPDTVPLLGFGTLTEPAVPRSPPGDVRCE